MFSGQHRAQRFFARFPAPHRRRLRQAAATVLITWLVMPAFAAVPAGELAALNALYSQTNGPGWTNSTNWGTGDPCDNSWFGIGCNAGGTSVTEISLGNNQLAGTLPSLAGLPGLTRFGAYSNQLTGPIPPLASLANLSVFDVYGNQLTGAIPSLAGLTQLSIFYVDDNQLTGSIPPLAGLTSLAEIDVGRNQLTGTIPSLTGLSNLSDFLARNNQLSGPIPPLAGLTNLDTFAVSNNQLTGSIPSLAGLTNLEDFHADANRLTGAIPSLAGLANLTDFSVGSNQLTGPVPDMPPSVELAVLCPNYLTPAAEPPSANDLLWNEAAGSTPWSADCTASPPVAAVNPVPTLGQWGVLLLGLLAAGLGTLQIRRRS